MAPIAPSRSTAWNAKLPRLNPFAALRRRRQPSVESITLPEYQGPNQPKAKDDDLDFVKKQEEYESDVRRFDRIAWVDLHIIHASIDVAYSLLGFALTINSAILTLAGAAFYYGKSGASPDDATLEGAHRLIKSYIGNGAAIIFAIALLCAGQSASITATLAGQVVSEGFLEWKTSPMVRRLVTRLIGVIPAAVVASAVGNRGLDTMLVASQVILSIVLPTVTIPLVYLCSKRDVMVVHGPEVNSAQMELSDVRPTTPIPSPSLQSSPSPLASPSTSPLPPASTSSSPHQPHELEAQTQAQNTEQQESTSQRRSKTYTSPKPVTYLGWLLNFIVVLANCYVIVQLCMGGV